MSNKHKYEAVAFNVDPALANNSGLLHIVVCCHEGQQKIA